MKKELKFYTSLPLFIIVVCVMWGVSLSLIYPFVVSFDAADFWWWASVFLIYGLSIGLPILIYPRTMSKIYLDETGVSKIIFRKSKEQFIKWEDVRDVQILTLPNGYAYVIISNSQIKSKSFEEVLKEKNVIYFTYNNEAVEFVNDKVRDRDLKL
jgi:hypothetical protein